MLPQPDERVDHPPLGTISVYDDHLKAGFQFPLHPFFVKIFNLYHVVPVQLTPNSILSICGFLVFCNILDIEPRTSLFTFFSY